MERLVFFPASNAGIVFAVQNKDQLRELDTTSRCFILKYLFVCGRMFL